MTEWDDIIKDIKNDSEVNQGKIIEPETVKSNGFEFSDILEDKISKSTSEVLNNSTFDPLNLVPIDRKKIKDDSAKGWFNMPVSNLTEEQKIDWEVLRMRNLFGETAANCVELPEKPSKYAQVATIVTHASQGRKANLTRRQRAPTILEQYSKNPDFNEYIKLKKAKLENAHKKLVFGD